MTVDTTPITRVAAALWGLKLGHASTQSVLAQLAGSGGNLAAVVDAAFNTSLAQTPVSTLVTQVVVNLGLRGNAAIDAAVYLSDLLAAVPAAKRGASLADAVQLFATLRSHPLYGPAASAFNAQVAQAVADAANPAALADQAWPSPSRSSTFVLTTGRDQIAGSSADDLFFGLRSGGMLTLDRNDMILGGAGKDTVFAEVSSAYLGGYPDSFQSRQFSDFERLVVRAIASPGDGAAQSPSPVVKAAVYALGTQHFESRSSEVDLMLDLIADFGSQQVVARDLQLAWVDSAPGEVDLAVQLPQNALQPDGAASRLTLEILDTRSAARGLDPLLESPYDGVTFMLDGQTITLRDTPEHQAIQYATTFAQFLAALQAAIDRTPGAAGVTASFGPRFTVLDSLGDPVSGTQIVLSAPGRQLATGNFVASAGVVGGGMHLAAFTSSGAADKPVVGNILLDGVGRGSNGGDLLVGAREYDYFQAGIDRFELTVDRSSRLATVNSTFNWLKEVVVRNTGVAEDLQVLGSDHVAGNSGAPLPADPLLPSSKDQHNHWGFSDVRLIDGSLMTGRLRFDAEVTPTALAKYVLLTQAQSIPQVDGSGFPLQATRTAEFNYAGGSNEDLIVVQLDGSIAASSGHIQPSMADFSFNIRGDGGNDQISLRLADASISGPRAGPGSPAHPLYLQQQQLKNASIDAGAGDDLVRTPGVGDVRINLGAGNDVAVLDNSGTQRAVWVLGTRDQSSPGAVPARELGALAPDATLNTYADNAALPGLEGLHRAELTLSYKGLSASAPLPADVLLPSDADIQQLVRALVAADPVLRHLLQVQEGPGQVQLISSFSDGLHVESDLSIRLKPWTLGATLDAASLAVYAQLNPADTTPSAAELQALLADGAAQFNARGEHVPRFAQVQGQPLSGQRSISPSDNTVAGDEGDDLIVMGTTRAAHVNESSNDTAVFAPGFGNDTILWFQAGAAATGGDRLDLQALGAKLAGQAGKLFSSPQGPGPGTIVLSGPNGDGSVHVHAQTPSTDSAAEVAALFVDSGAASTIATRGVYIAVIAGTNQAMVYAVTDPVGANNLKAELAGSIDLADTPWFNLGVDNFV